MTQEAREILSANQYCTIATITPQRTPWGVPVRFASDEEFIYFRSSPEALHSNNITANPAIAVTVFDTTQAVKGAVYIHSRAQKLDGEEEKQAIELFNQRFSNPQAQWEVTSYFRVAIGTLDTEKTIDRMYYFQEQTI